MANPYQNVGNKGKQYTVKDVAGKPGPGAWYEHKAPGQDPSSPYGGYTEGAGWKFWEDDKKYWKVDPSSYQMDKGVPGWAQRGAELMAGKKAGQDMRARSQQAMDYMQRVMSGQESAARQQAQFGLQQGMQDIAARAGSMQRGGYHPATARASLLAQEQMGAKVAGSTAVAAAQERQAAAAAYGQAAQAARGLDVQQMVAMESLAQQYRLMGMTDKYNEVMNRIALEKHRHAAFTGADLGGVDRGKIAQLAFTAVGAGSGDPQVAQMVGQFGKSLYS